MKRIVSLVLAVVLLFTCGSTFVFADEFAEAAEATAAPDADPSNTPPARI